MKKILKDTLALTVITVVIGLLLGIVYEVTKGPIAKQEEKAKMEACAEVFPDAASFESIDITQDSEEFHSLLDASGYKAQSVDEISYALDQDGNRIGLVLIVTSSEGYGGDIQFSMGVSEDGTLKGISFLSISETAGLGMRADTEEFKKQFKGKKCLSFY